MPETPENETFHIASCIQDLIKAIMQWYRDKDLRGLSFEIGTARASKMGDTDPTVFADFVTAIWPIAGRSISGFDFGCRCRCGWNLR